MTAPDHNPPDYAHLLREASELVADLGIESTQPVVDLFASSALSNNIDPQAVALVHRLLARGGTLLPASAAHLTVRLTSDAGEIRVHFWPASVARKVVTKRDTTEWELVEDAAVTA